MIPGGNGNYRSAVESTGLDSQIRFESSRQTVRSIRLEKHMALDVSSVPDQIREWLQRAIEAGASDLHLIVGYPPVLRVHGDLTELPEPTLNGDESESLLHDLCPIELRAQLHTQKNVDFSFSLIVNGRVQRFRANLFHSGKRLGACLRVVPGKIPELAWAEFPPALAQQLARLRDGLVIVTGATGSGKTTTLAMIVNLLNK